MDKRNDKFIFDSGKYSQEWLAGYWQGVQNARWHYRNGMVEALKRIAVPILFVLFVLMLCSSK